MAGSAGTGDSNDVMTLRVWKSGWGLPSIESECLQAMACVKFASSASSVPIRIVECEDPGRSPTGMIPFFTHKSKLLSSADEIVSYLREQGYGCDFGLNSKQCAEVVAFTHLINDALKPALIYFNWIHMGNFDETIRLCYGERLPWLYKMWYPFWRVRRRHLNFLLVTFPEYEYHMESCEPYVMQKATDCIKVLSDKLGTNEYFMVPDKPTSIDALIYSYIAPLLKIPLVHGPLREVIRATPNLERYVARITHHYFMKTAGDANWQASNLSQTNYGKDGHPTKQPMTSSNTDSSSQFALKHKILTFVVLAAAMFTYAVKHRMIKLPPLKGRRDNYYEDDFDDAEDENEEFWEE